MRRFSEERAQRHTLALLEICVYLCEVSRNKALPIALREQAMTLFRDYPSVTEIIILAKRDHGATGSRCLLANVEKELFTGDKYPLLRRALHAEALRKKL